MNDQLEAEVPETVETESVDTGEAQTEQELPSDTVSDSGENHEQKPMMSPEQKATAEQAFKARESQREAKALRKELDDLRAQQSEVARPVVPELSEFPEPEEITAFTEATRQAALHDANKSMIATQQQTLVEQAQQKEQAVLYEKVQVYSQNATKLGVKPDDLQVAGNLVAHELREDIQIAVLDDVDGPLITMHLATNPQALAALNGANVLTIGQVYSDIKAAAANLKPKQSEAPPPAEQLSGAGAPPTQGGPAGVVYE